MFTSLHRSSQHYQADLVTDSPTYQSESAVQYGHHPSTTSNSSTAQSQSSINALRSSFDSRQSFTPHQIHPTLILDSTSSAYALNTRTPQQLSQFIKELMALPVPISNVDMLPRTEQCLSVQTSHVNSSKGQANSSISSTQSMQSMQSPDSLATLFSIKAGTKVAITSSAPIGLGNNELKPVNVRDGLMKSLRTIRPTNGTLEYLVAQRPDGVVSIGEVAGGFGALVAEGLVKMWGVREFSKRDMSSILRVCERRGFEKPRVYQGAYNVLDRPDDDLMRLLKSEGIIFQAYSPTANGFLLKQILPEKHGEFPLEHSAKSSPAQVYSPNFQSNWRNTFDTPENRKTVEKIQTIATKYDVTLLSASLRWLAYHSQLTDTDSIILGGVDMRDLFERVTEIAKGPLPIELAELISNTKP